MQIYDDYNKLGGVNTSLNRKYTKKWEIFQNIYLNLNKSF